MYTKTIHGMARALSLVSKFRKEQLNSGSQSSYLLILNLFSPPHKNSSYIACHIKRYSYTLGFLLFSFQTRDL